METYIAGLFLGLETKMEDPRYLFSKDTQNPKLRLIDNRLVPFSFCSRMPVPDFNAPDRKKSAGVMLDISCAWYRYSSYPACLSVQISESSRVFVTSRPDPGY